jgi:hypothetical protein
MTFVRRVVYCAALCAAVVPLLAEEVAVPMDVQVALFATIWKLDRTFKPGPLVSVAVLYQQEYRPSANAALQFLAAVQAAGLPIVCKLIDLDEQGSVRERLPSAGVDVFYVAPLRAIDVTAIATISRANRIRTITGVPSYVVRGLAVGIGLSKQRPVIIINLRAARAEGSEFRAQLLKLSRVIEEGGTAYVGGPSE